MFSAVYRRLLAVLSARYFFYGIVALFVISGSWLVLTSRYPMAFDENYHYGIIQQYAKQWGPFFSNPPAGSESLGDITRYPAYLYHYLMSFPYRLFGLFFESDTVKIILLRFINLAMLASSLVIFKKLFEQAKVSRALTNLVLAVFVATPIVPFLGAHINYDNAVVPLTALLLLLAWRYYVAIQNKLLRLDYLVWIGVVGLATGLMKYTSLPVFVLVVGWLGVISLWRLWKDKLSLTKLVVVGWRVAKKPALYIGIAFLVILSGLSIERYGLNLIRYGQPVPDCAQVISEKSCLQYGPWGRDYRLKQNKFGPPSWGPVRYTGHWLGQTMHETFFTVNDRYEVGSPLPILYNFAWAFGMGGLLLLILNAKKVLSNPALILFAVVGLGYGIVLWLDNYGKFTSVNWPVAIHGRYWLPILPLIYLLLAYGFKLTIDRFPNKARRGSQLLLLSILAVALVQGGSLLPYVVRSDSSWYWPNNSVISINQKLQQITRPLIAK